MINIAIISSGKVIEGAAHAACEVIGVYATIRVFSSVLQFLKTTTNYNLLLVDSDVVELQDFGEVLSSKQWVYIGSSDVVAIDVLQYRPIAGCNVDDSKCLEHTLVSALTYVLEEEASLGSVDKSKAISLQRINGNTIDLDISEIAYCSTNGDFLDIYVQKEERFIKITVQERMKTLAGTLSTKGFVQVHRFWLVNIKFVLKDHPYPKDRIFIKGGFEIPLARRRKMDFLKVYRSQ